MPVAAATVQQVSTVSAAGRRWPEWVNSDGPDTWWCFL